MSRQPVITRAIDGIDEDDWIDIAYTDGGTAQVAGTTWDRWWLIVRRTRIEDDPNLPVLFAGWRHHAFVTNRTGEAVQLDQEHRAHAVVELAIRDLKHGAGLNHCPSATFNANAAWLLATTLAHNLIRWTQLLGTPDTARLANAKTFRRRLLTIPGRLTRSARRFTLHLPTRWLWSTCSKTPFNDFAPCPRPCDRTGAIARRGRGRQPAPTPASRRLT